MEDGISHIDDYGGGGGDFFPALGVRAEDGHKGSFGTVMVVGGCDDGITMMIGAPALVARGALRSGCGVVRVVVPRSILKEVLLLEPSATGVGLVQKEGGVLHASKSAEVIDRFKGGVDVIAIGPGFGVGFEQQQILMRLLGEERLIVLDADGLNNVAAIADFAGDIRASMVITPHVGEYLRLAEALGLEGAHPAGNKGERVEAAERLAQRLGCVVVLKGAGSVVTDGVRSWVCPVREAALAVAGSGDVLTGIIAGLIAQYGKGVGDGNDKVLTLLQAAAWGVRIHGEAGLR